MRARAVAVMSALTVFALQTGCSTGGWRLPDDYVGPTASLRTATGRTSFSRQEWFRFTHINGHEIGQYYPVPWPSPEWRKEKGPWTQPGHLVPANKSVTVTVAGKDAWETAGAGQGAAIVDMITGIGTIFDRPGKSVEGNVVFRPKAGGAYIVTGRLERNGSSMWIEDKVTGKRVSSVITDKDKSETRDAEIPVGLRASD